MEETKEVVAWDVLAIYLGIKSEIVR